MEIMPTVLVVDDEAAILRLVELALIQSGLRVRTARNGIEALAAFADAPIDLVVMDLLMPEMDGAEALRRIRATSAVPVLMLTASTQEAQRVALLAAGADDVQTKPFNPHELAARVQVILRRTTAPGSAATHRLVYDTLVLDLALRRVVRDGAEVRLSRTEWELLSALAADVGRVVQGRQLLTAVWGREYADQVQYLHMWLSRLRRKLGEELPLETLPGIGYRLAAPQRGDAEAPMAG